MIRIAIVDDESLVAQSLGTLLGLEDDLVVETVCASGEELLDWWQRRLVTGEPVPEVCVCDLQLGGIDGIETAVRITELSPTAGTLIVTSHARPPQLRRALTAGIRGFLAKTSSAEEFAAAIREVHAGKRHIDRELAAATIAAGESPLTQRETEVLGLAGQGGSVDDIAAAAHLAPGTTRNYLSSAMSKVGAQNRFEAHMRARELGWV